MGVVCCQVQTRINQARPYGTVFTTLHQLWANGKIRDLSRKKKVLQEGTTYKVRPGPDTVSLNKQAVLISIHQCRHTQCSEFGSEPIQRFTAYKNICSRNEEKHNKTTGPDGIPARLLKSTSAITQLPGIT